MQLKTADDYLLYETEEKDKFEVSFDSSPIPFGWGNTSVYREINSLGSKAHLSINIGTLPQSFKKDEATLSILLPNYYSTTLTSMNSVYCSINNTNSSCIVYSNHTVFFPSLPVLEMNYSMIINITGLEIPYFNSGKYLTITFEMN